MVQKILLRRSHLANLTPSVTELDYGELAINTIDGKVFLKRTLTGSTADDEIIEIGIGVSAFSDLTDTEISDVQNNDYIEWDDTAGPDGTGAWVNKPTITIEVPETLNDMADVNLASAASGDALVYTGTSWVAGKVGNLIKDGLGYRINGLSSDTLGSDAVNLSSQGVASGSSSTAMGKSTTASSNYSTAMGKYTTASGDYSTAMGKSTTASGDYSTAMGKSTTASGNTSTAMGKSTTASGDYSTAMGYYTTASGDYSTAMGYYNIGTSTETIVEVGTGADDSNRKNAFEIYLDGRVVTPELTTTLITTGGDKSLITKEYLLSPDFGSSLPTTDPAVPGRLWNDGGIVKVSV